ncbi:FeoA family protein [Salinimonas sediminis]|uniref:Ferrous iron transport protein A n=1 Tax=Salinimonas sediminis TaxID=2303538 RepID=A0A346NRP3_9ALTE|nr:FeoA family protein [Salinimonas sediminis]AXR08200.1 ferrous iron transport protein A [Salinimonas sediminis]
MTLWDLPSKKLAVITKIHNDLYANVIERLSEMGVEEGRDVQCVRKGPLGGPVVLQLGGSIFAIEQDLASKIEVAPHA